MVTIEPPVRMGQHSWLLKYSSNLSNPTFYIYLDGNLIAETKQTEYTIAVNLDEVSLIEILDDPDASPMQVFPGKARLGWFFVEGTDYYRVDEYINETWVERRRLPENNGYLQWESRFLEDGQTHLFHVVPIGINGNEGEAKQFAVLMVRRPDVPDVDYSYNEGTGNVTVYDESSKIFYNVTGNVNPDCTCNYEFAGIYNGKTYTRRTDGAWFNWWMPSPYNFWIISTSLGQMVGPAYWKREDPNMIGEYQPQGGSGIAVVAEGTH